MASLAHRVPAHPAAVAGPTVPPVVQEPVVRRPAPVRPVSLRAVVAGGRAARTVAPVTTRREGVRPGARPAPLGAVAGGRPVRGGCAPEVGVGGAPGWGAPAAVRPSAPLRLTERGRRVVAGLSVAIGLSIASVTVVTVQLGGADGGLQLAGSSTVVVQSGDTLWSIARAVAPEEDPRLVVDAIVDLNGLDGVDLLPGAELRLP